MRITKEIKVPNNPKLLHDALAAAGVPVTTIRSDWSDDLTVCICSVVVFEEGYDPDSNPEYQQELTKHLNFAGIVGKSVAIPAGYDMNAALARMKIL